MVDLEVTADAGLILMSSAEETAVLLQDEAVHLETVKGLSVNSHSRTEATDEVRYLI